MATNLVDTLISNLPIVFVNAEGAVVASPAGATPSVTIDNPAVGTVVIGSDGSSVDFTPTQPPFASTTINITALFTRTDGAVLTVTGAYTVGEVADVTAVSGTFNDAGITTRPLA